MLERLDKFCQAVGHRSHLDWKLSVALALMIFSSAVIAYGPSIRTGFVWDAEFIYLHYQDVKDIGNLKDVFVTPIRVQVGGDGEREQVHNYYRPLTKAFYTVSYYFFGENPVGYKVVSVFLHGLVAILVYGVVVSVTSNPLVSAMAALLFAVNPVHTEAVVWSYSVSYLLVGAFALATLLLYRKGFIIVALVTFLAALLSHEMGVVVLPLLLFQSWLVDGARKKGEFVLLVPFLIILVGFLFLRSSIVGSIPLSDVNPVIFLNAAVIVVLRYLKIFLWPDSPVTIYQYEEFPTFSTELFLAYAASSLLLYLVYYFWKNDHKSLFWLLWFGVWVTPSLNIGRLGEYLMAEKLLYMASIGLSALAMTWLARLFRPRFSFLLLCLVPLLVLQANQAWSRISHWKNTPTYLEAALEHSPDFYLALYSLAQYRIKDKHYAEAIGYLERCVESEPSYSPGLNNLGNLYYVDGQLHLAIRYWERAATADKTNPMPYFNIGVAARKLGRLDDAKFYFDEYLRNEPNPPLNVLEKLRSFGY